MVKSFIRVLMSAAGMAVPLAFAAALLLGAGVHAHLEGHHSNPVAGAGAVSVHYHGGNVARPSDDHSMASRADYQGHDHSVPTVTITAISPRISAGLVATPARGEAVHAGQTRIPGTEGGIRHSIPTDRSSPPLRGFIVYSADRAPPHS